MRKNYDFSRAIKNPYAKRLQRQPAVAPTPMNKEENRIAIKLSCANCSGIDSASVYEFIAKQGSDYEVYALRPRSGMAAALELSLVLSSAASVASIAGFLWLAYDRLIAPKKRGPKDDAGINIVIFGPDGIRVQVWLGKDVHTQAEFESGFEFIFEQAQNPEWRAAHKETIEEIQETGSWVRISIPKESKTNKTSHGTMRGREYQR